MIIISKINQKLLDYSSFSLNYSTNPGQPVYSANSREDIITHNIVLIGQLQLVYQNVCTQIQKPRCVSSPLASRCPEH